MKKKWILFLLMALTACKESIDPDINDMFLIENHAFLLYFPTQDWKLVNQQGTDSYVGYYERGNDRIYFDHGMYAGIINKDNNKNLLSYEETTVNGKKAVIAREKTNTGFVLTAIIRKGGDDAYTSTKLYANNPGNEKEIIKIFRTHRFK